jgi:hypothetical protein
VSYNPINLTMYTMAVSGAVEGIGIAGRPITSTIDAVYATAAQAAEAYAEAFDTAWDSAVAPDTFQAMECLEASAGYFRERQFTSINPSDYAAVANAIITCINEAEAVLLSKGITPAPWPGGSSGNAGGDLSGSYPNPYVKSLSGNDGDGGTIPLLSSATIQQTQGGNIGDSPANTLMLVLQPRDPARAPFQHLLYSANFNGQTDPVYVIGYNANFGNATEPVVYIGTEGRYFPSAGIQTIEQYFECAPTGASSGGNIYRPVGYSLNITSQLLTTTLQYVGELVLNGGPWGGPSVQQWQVADNGLNFLPTNYNVTGANGLGIIATTGRLTLQASSGSGQLLTRGEVEYDYCDVKNIGQFSELGTATQDNNVSGFRLYPNTTATGSIGLAGNYWGAIFGTSVAVGSFTTQQVTKTSAYTIDSSEPDRTIWVNTTGGAFALTLPAPTQGRELIVVDSGNDLASNHVTLTRHGSENINGSAANLSLATSGAIYLISSDGTNWWVAKMAVGG